MHYVPRKELLFVFIAMLFLVTAKAQNPIVTENALAGTPKSTWDVSGAGDQTIQGFATDISVNKGQTVHFKIETSPAASYTITIYRIGYYQGNGARLIASLGTFSGIVQPDGAYNASTGLLDCSNWSESASWAVPSTAVTGLYIAKITKTSGGGGSHIPFIVRDDASTADILLKTSDNTWQAYNPYGGNSLYVGSTSYPNGHAAKVSLNRPYITRAGGGGGGAGQDWYMNAEYPMIKFLERNGYNIAYTTDVDLDRSSTPITPANHKLIISSGHDEYWSLNERNKVEAARDAGVHLAFFSGNEVYWKVRWENNFRTLVCYKEGTLGENVCGNKCDPTSAWTGLWRDGAAYDAGKPENNLTGQISWSDVSSAISVTSAYKNLWFWRSTAVASLSSGSVTFTAGTLGYEWDFQQYPEAKPHGQIALSSQTVSGKEHRLSLYRAPSGALVFGSGTVQWAWGLDNIHDNGSAAANINMQQATVNLFADMGVQPATLMSGLTLATASTDFTAPTVNITSPANGASLTNNSPVTISGNASDAGGGVLIGVEISVDGGTTWQAVNGTSSWTFSWTPNLPGPATIKVRGWDDRGNMGVPGASGSSSNINVTISGSVPTCPCSIFPASVSPTLPNDHDGQPIEVGVKIRSSQAGYITGVRFWKGSSTNTPTHIGHLWSSTGTKLAEATFGTETSSGWQTVTFASPVAISANTTYVASYYSPSGYYSSTNPYFSAATTNGYLTALANGTDGSNGVYLYGAGGGFPINGFQSQNNWVDIVFTANVTPDTTPPTVSLTAPAAGTVSGVVNITANANDNIGVAGVQFLLNGANLGAEVTTAPYTYSWNTTSVANGTYTLAARARDGAGLTTTSTGVVVTVNNVPDTQAPIVSITAPAAGTIASTINVTANASDNVGVVGVQFLLNGANLGAEDLTAPYSISWNTFTVANGTYTLTARARDGAGNTTTSTGVIVTVTNTSQLIAALPLNETTGTNAADISGNSHPGTLVSSPTWGAGKYGNGLTFNGTSNYVTIADHADFSLDPAQSYTWSGWLKNASFKEWSTVWSQTLDGNNFFYFYAHTTTDPDGGPVTNGLSVYWWNGGGSSKLGAHSTNNVLTAGVWSYVAVTYDASQPQNNRFTIYVNGVDVTDRSDVGSTGTLAAINPVNVRIGSNAPFGEYLNGSVDEIRFYKRLLSSAEVATDMNSPLAPDVTAPAVNITAPAAGNVSATINVTANASDNVAVVGVQFLLDGVNLGAEDIASPFSVSWNTTTATNGNHTLTARARDAAGNNTTSVGVIVNVNNVSDTELPVASITAPAAGDVSATINVTANATDNIGVVGVQFKLDGVNLGAEDVAAPYSVSWNTTTATNGNHNLTAVARDAAGNLGTSAVVVVNVNNVPDTQVPTVNITAPAAGTVLGTINVTANAADNIAVVGVQFLLDGVNLGAEDVVAPYSVSWNTLTAINGAHVLTARARDAAGNNATSAPVNVTVSNPTNLIVALPLNETTGTTAADISGLSHPGTLVSSPTWGAGKYGNGLTFNGTSNYVTIADHADFTLDPTQSYTWSAWVKNNSFKEWSTVWSQTLNSSNFFYFYAHTSTDPDGGPVTNGISAYWWNTGGTNKLGVHSTNNVLTLGQWSYVAVTYNASQPQNNRFTIYVNGVDVTDRSDVGSTGTLAAINPTNTRVGSNQPFGEYLSGSVDEVRFYKRLLTSTEVNSDMNSPLAPIGGRVGGTIVQTQQQQPGKEAPVQEFEVKVTPNPSASYFNLIVMSADKAPVIVRVLDISGRTVGSLQRMSSNSILRLGETWTAGTYFAEVIQGDQHRVIKMVKTK
jgi:hypothetical protein